MAHHVDKVRDYLLDLGLVIDKELPEEELFVVSDEESGIHSLVVDCEDPILVLEQRIMPVPEADRERFFLRLLQMNRTLVHGAFVVDEEAANVLFRDTLQLENLDKNELEGTIRALELALVEHGDELLRFARSRGA
ncbi:Putative sensory transduction regulator [Desulfacinum hydrothermale DSM 13146]|uniref:Putative sensory transduction regulator n=1 Tax=Desulfacinum hydrothermale DSM 13146 TaxID=1121390 RepID=A0A1W1XPQ6_9BACT|nr:YbjN domain-containing protein [Desulfacinum hydrothermale]SMC25970.1 Putative sensory transduction regulator [Desulfacinum hydrothermale DSM 13146]